MENVEDDASVEVIAAKMLTSLSEPFHVNGKEIFTSGSLGVVPYPGTAENIDEVLKNVDTAIHHAKRQGRANYQFYTNELSSDVQRRMEIEAGLRHALRNDEFELFYQAKVDLGSHVVTGAEALLRVLTAPRAIGKSVARALASSAPICASAKHRRNRWSLTIQTPRLGPRRLSPPVPA